VPESMASVTNASYITCYDKLDQHEVKDMLICFLYIVSNLSEGSTLLPCLFVLQIRFGSDLLSFLHSWSVILVTMTRVFKTCIHYVCVPSAGCFS